MTRALIHIESFPRQTTKSDLLSFLNSVAGMERQHVGRIDLLGNKAVIEVPDGWQARLAQALDGRPLGGRRVRIWAEGPVQGEDPGADHFERLARLLEMESRAEAREAAERGRHLSARLWGLSQKREKNGVSLPCKDLRQVAFQRRGAPPCDDPSRLGIIAPLHPPSYPHEYVFSPAQRESGDRALMPYSSYDDVLLMPSCTALCEATIGGKNPMGCRVRNSRGPFRSAA